MVVTMLKASTRDDYFVFLDINGVAGIFADKSEWQQAIKGFLIDQQYAVGAYGAVTSKDGSALFGLRKLDTDKMADVILSAEDDLRLSSLFESDISKSGGLVNSNNQVVEQLSDSVLISKNELTPVERKHFLNDLFLRNNLAEYVKAGQNFRDQAKLDKLYQDYLYFLQGIKGDLDAGEVNASGYSLQEWVTREYYYSRSSETPPLTQAETTGFVDAIIEVAQSYRQFGHDNINKEYPYVVINAPDEIDKSLALELNRSLKPFQGLSISQGHIDNQDALKRAIENSGVIEFYPQDFYQRMSGIINLSKLVINVDKDKIPETLAFANRLYDDPKFSHRILKVAIAGPNFYDRTTERLAIHYASEGPSFNRELMSFIRERLDDENLTPYLIDLVPVGMYPVQKGVGYLSMSKNLKQVQDFAYQWGVIDSPVKSMNTRLLELTDESSLKVILSAAKPMEVLKQDYAMTEEGPFYYYDDNPALLMTGRQNSLEESLSEQFGIEMSRVRSLKYFDSTAYHAYRNGLENYHDVPQSGEVNDIIERYRNGSPQESGESLVRMIELLQGHSIPAEQMVGLVGSFAETNETNFHWWEDTTGPLAGDFLWHNQSALIGSASTGCCYSMALMVSWLLEALWCLRCRGLPGASRAAKSRVAEAVICAIGK